MPPTPADPNQTPPPAANNPSRNECYDPPWHQRLDALCDELGIIHRLLGKPEACRPGEVMDVVRMSVGYMHSRLERLAWSMRIDHDARSIRAVETAPPADPPSGKDVALLFNLAEMRTSTQDDISHLVRVAQVFGQYHVIAGGYRLAYAAAPKWQPYGDGSDGGLDPIYLIDSAHRTRDSAAAAFQTWLAQNPDTPVPGEEERRRKVNGAGKAPGGERVNEAQPSPAKTTGETEDSAAIALRAFRYAETWPGHHTDIAPGVKVVVAGMGLHVIAAGHRLVGKKTGFYHSEYNWEPYTDGRLRADNLDDSRHNTVTSARWAFGRWRETHPDDKVPGQDPPPEKKPAPQAHGVVSRAVRAFVNARAGPFTIADVTDAMVAEGVSFNGAAIAAVLKRMLRDKEIVRTRPGGSRVRAIYELSKNPSAKKPRKPAKGRTGGGKAAP